MNLGPDAITAIWTALSSGTPRLPRSTSRADAQIVAKGWLSRAELEDYMIIHDSRLGAANVPHPADFAKALGLPLRIVYSRPDHPNDENFGFESLSMIDVAYLCIWFERLGFQTNVSNLCDQLRSSAIKTEYLSEQETAVLFFEATRHRLPPITLTSPEFSIQPTTVKRAKTSTGYGLKYARGKDGKAHWLECRAPKYRKRPAPKSVTCPQCGLEYLKGSRVEEQNHRSQHRQRMSVLAPQPSARFARARQRNPEISWVGSHSPSWVWDEVYQRARAFSREFGYSLQWESEPRFDDAALGFLFHDDQDRLVGACAFRPRSHPSEKPWRLDWIWLCPDERRKGHLGRQWETFRSRFGDFDVEPPLSSGMKAFLMKYDYAESGLGGQ